MDCPKIICLTPVYNESWILDRFIQCAGLWADKIIIADQGSTDGSREIAQRYEKVIFVDNSVGGDFNEFTMRNPLFVEARKIEGPKILISLDADEILTPNFDSPEWNTISKAKPGTVLSFPIHNLLPNGTYWHFGDIYCGYVDDGAPYDVGTVHVPRTIIPEGHDILLCHDICLLHYKFMDPGRMQDRNRWYQCFELVNGINDPITIFNRYHHLEIIPMDQRIGWPTCWISEYAKLGIEITSVLHQQEQRWNKQIIEYFIKHGVSRFRHLNIWTVNWCDRAKALGYTNYNDFKDPRNQLDKAINRYLISSRAKPSTTWRKFVVRLLRLIYK